jgi:putative PIN family toxin of toxin-antitoxin system
MKAEHPKLVVVCDTNVLLSMLGFPGGRLDVLWNIILADLMVLVLSDFILQELIRNFRLKARLSEQDTSDILDLLRNHARIVATRKHIAIIKDCPADNRILECAIKAQANVLITGDLKHIRPIDRIQATLILTPREFLDQYFPGN